jgi:hypothetical protein
MVFDIRGKRRNVVKVVYAILALLMGLSLFLLAGPGIGGLFSTGNAVNEAAGQFEDQAARIEQKLVKSPEDPDLLLSLARTRVNAANSSVSLGSNGEPLQTVESQQQLNQASEAWSKYLEASDEPSPGGALVMSNALFTLASTSRTVPEAELNVQAAADAQKIVAKARPSINSLSTLAFYKLYTFDYAGAAKAKNEARAFANTKVERESLDNQFEEVSKRAHEFQKQAKESREAAKRAAKQGGKSPESLENSLGGLGGGALGE